ncbi:hypothetical protein PF003_g19967 [Phytophthora fragariae]|nr:hypothetical protein PF003_g19967 [Phytophthora fragariae]
MRLYHLLALAAVVAQTSAVSKSTLKTRLNGWYKCSDYTFSDQGSSSGQSSECATFNAPLCYPGICKAPQFADRRLMFFVKRMPATTGDPKVRHQRLAPTRWSGLFLHCDGIVDD